MIQKQGLLLVNLGTPSEPTASAIRRYLREFLSDQRVVELPKWLWLPILYGFVLTRRPRKLVEKYRSIWLPKGSPLLVYCQELTASVQKKLPEWQVELAMTYGKPSIDQALLKLKGCNKITVLPLYPQHSASTSGAVFDRVAQKVLKWRNMPNLEFIRDYATEPAYIQELADRIQFYIDANGLPDKLIFSFHGLPKACIEKGDTYQKDCEATVLAVVQQLKLKPNQWMMTFQSRFGLAKWLEPYTDLTLVDLAKQGVKSVAIICPGFVVDCLETLEEIAETNKHLFLSAGGKRYDYISIPSTAEVDSIMNLVSQ